MGHGGQGPRGPPILETDNATQEEAVYAMATGRSARSGGGTDWGALKRLLAGNAGSWDQKVVNGYSQYVQSIIDSIVDEIVKGEAPDASGKPAAEPAAGAAPEYPPPGPGAPRGPAQGDAKSPRGREKLRE